MISQESRLPLSFLEDLEFHSELSTGAKLTNKRISRIGSFSASTELHRNVWHVLSCDPKRVRLCTLPYVLKWMYKSFKSILNMY